MSVQTDLEQRTAQLRSILSRSNSALTDKGGSAASDLYGIPAAIANLPAAGSEYPAMEVPEKYLSYVEYGLEHFYNGDFEHLMVLDNSDYGGDWILAVYMLPSFTIVGYDPETTEFQAIGFHACGYNKNSDQWAGHHVITDPPGTLVAKTIQFASCEIEYNGQKLFPLGIHANILFVDSKDALPETAAEGTIAIVG